MGITPNWALTIRNGRIAGRRASFDRDQGTGATCVEQSPTAALPVMSRTRREMADRAAPPAQEVDQGPSEAAAPELTMRTGAPSPEMSRALPTLQAADAAWPRPDARHERGRHRVGARPPVGTALPPAREGRAGLLSRSGRLDARHARPARLVVARVDPLARGAVRRAGAPSDRRRIQVRAAGGCARRVRPRTVGS